MQQYILSQTDSDYIKFCREHALSEAIKNETENHHIWPDTFGGDESPENKVHLTIIDHVKAHILLPDFLMDLGLEEEAHTMKGTPAFILARYGFDLEEFEKDAKTLEEIYRTSKTLIGEKMSERLTGMIFITDGNNSHIHNPKDPIPEGWRRGSTRYSEEGKENCGKVNRGRIQMNKNGKNRRFWPHEREQKLKEGWILGYTPRENLGPKGKKIYNNGKISKYFFEGTQPSSWVPGFAPKNQ